MKLGTVRTVIAEAQISNMLDEGWQRLDLNGMSWENYKEMINNYLKEQESENRRARAHSYTE